MKVTKRKTIDEKEKSRIIAELKKFLEQEDSIVFAYLYGSFNQGNHFNDIDVAVYIDDVDIAHQEKTFDYQLSLATRAELFIDG